MPGPRLAPGRSVSPPRTLQLAPPDTLRTCQPLCASPRSRRRSQCSIWRSEVSPRSTRSWLRCPGNGCASRTAVPLEVLSLGDGTNLAHLAALQGRTQEVTQRLIAARIGRLLLLQAGAVSHSITGQSLVSVAPGGTENPTLGCVLGRTLGYLTDENVGINDSGRIRPCP